MKRVDSDHKGNQQEQWVVRIEARYEPIRAPCFKNAEQAGEDIFLRRRIQTILHRYNLRGRPDPLAPSYAIVHEPEQGAPVHPFFRIEFLYPRPKGDHEAFMGVTRAHPAKGSGERTAALAYLGESPPAVIAEYREDIVPLKTAAAAREAPQTLSVQIGIRPDDPRRFELFFDLVLPRWMRVRPPRSERQGKCEGEEDDHLLYLVRTFLEGRSEGEPDCEKTRKLKEHFAYYRVPYLEKRLHLHVKDAEPGRLYGLRIAAPVIEEIIATQGWPMDGLEPAGGPVKP